MKAARPRSEGEVSRGNTGIDSNLGEGRAVTLEPYPTDDNLILLWENASDKDQKAKSCPPGIRRESITPISNGLVPER